MKKFLITGFSGFVSRHFCEYLEQNNIHSLVKGIDVHSCNFKLDGYKSINIDFEIVDLLDKGKVESIISEFQPDYILHLASYSSVAFSWKDPIKCFQNNTNIFLNLLEAVRKFNLYTRILSIGSSEEYGNVEKRDLPLTENHPLKPVSPYAVARVSQELLSQVYVKGFDLDIVMTRSFNHVGAYQKEIFVVSSFIKQLVELKNNSIKNGVIITGDLNIIRDFTDVRDVVFAYYLLLTRGKKGEVYNVCSGKGFILKEILNIISYILKIEVKTKTDTNLVRPSDNKMIIGSNNKIKNDLNWDNRFTIEQSISDMINYWRTQL